MRAVLVTLARLLGLASPAPVPAAPAAPAPESPPATGPDTTATWGHEAKSHGLRLLGDRYELLLPAPGPLPPDVHRWIYAMDTAQLRHVSGPAIPAWMIEQHVRDGARGCLHSLGYVLPGSAKRQQEIERAEKEGRSGGGGGPARITAEDLMAAIGHSPGGPRRR